MGQTKKKSPGHSRPVDEMLDQDGISPSAIECTNRMVSAAEEECSRVSEDISQAFALLMTAAITAAVKHNRRNDFLDDISITGILGECLERQYGVRAILGDADDRTGRKALPLARSFLGMAEHFAKQSNDWAPVLNALMSVLASCSEAAGDTRSVVRSLERFLDHLRGRTLDLVLDGGTITVELPQWVVTQVAERSGHIAFYVPPDCPGLVVLVDDAYAGAYPIPFVDLSPRDAVILAEALNREYDISPEHVQAIVSRSRSLPPDRVDMEHMPMEGRA